MPTIPHSSLQSLEHLFALLSKRWRINEAATTLVRTYVGPVPQIGHIMSLKLQDHPGDCIVGNKNPPTHPLLIGLENGPLRPEQINGNFIVCCHQPSTAGYVLAFDATQGGPDQTGLLTVWDTKNGFPPGAKFAQMTVHSLFTNPH